MFIKNLRKDRNYSQGKKESNGILNIEVEKNDQYDFFGNIDNGQNGGFKSVISVFDVNVKGFFKLST